MEQEEQQLIRQAAEGQEQAFEQLVLRHQKGIYNLKDSVQITANILMMSKNTVYMHLRNLEK